jgi:hypothetical protein
MQAVCEAAAPLSDAEMNSFKISIHGMKSALANVGEIKCSKKAKVLEQMTQGRQEQSIKKELPEFLDALRQIIDKLRAAE